MRKLIEKMKNFISGLGNVLNIGGRELSPPPVKNPYKKDWEKIQGDWKKVGSDFYTVFDKIKKPDHGKSGFQKKHKKTMITNTKPNQITVQPTISNNYQ